MTNNTLTRSYLYGRLEALYSIYETAARKEALADGQGYLVTHAMIATTKPYTTFRDCKAYLFERTDLAKIFREKNPELESRLLGIIEEVEGVIAEKYGEDNDPLDYGYVFGSSKQESDLGLPMI